MIDFEWGRVNRGFTWVFNPNVCWWDMDPKALPLG